MKYLTLGILVFGLIMFCIGLYEVFLLGIHGFDNAQNMIFIRDDLKFKALKENITLNTAYIEWDTGGNVISFEDAYSLGMKRLIEGIWLSIISSVIIGFGLGFLVGEK